MKYKDIYGYKFAYRINELGIVEKRKASGEWVSVHVYTADGNPYVKFRVESGKTVKKRVKDLMRDAFMGKSIPGCVVDYVSKDRTDNSLRNLHWVKESERRVTNAKSTPVCKIDDRGKILARYGTMKQAAEDNYVSVEAVSTRCRGQVKHPFRNYGFSFKYDKKGE